MNKKCTSARCCDTSGNALYGGFFGIAVAALHHVQHAVTSQIPETIPAYVRGNSQEQLLELGEASPHIKHSLEKDCSSEPAKEKASHKGRFEGADLWGRIGPVISSDPLLPAWFRGVNFCDEGSCA